MFEVNQNGLYIVLTFKFKIFEYEIENINEFCLIIVKNSKRLKHKQYFFYSNDLNGGRLAMTKIMSFGIISQIYCTHDILVYNEAYRV